jgi:hypothetical protein
MAVCVPDRRGTKTTVDVLEPTRLDEALAGLQACLEGIDRVEGDIYTQTRCGTCVFVGGRLA